ncbi:MAG: hypothetical protein M3Z56_01760 [Bacteroidota bacterium]|nr:hypothetical protein [Bacteroidota bacterium]
MQPLSAAERLNNDIISLKKAVNQGDLIVRMTDDLISEQIKFLNEKDKIYSHAGLVIVKNKQPFVCHIAPNEINGDTIQIEPIDSFINPSRNISCALYRYDLLPNEKDSLIKILLNYKAKNIHFDWLYDLNTDNKMYCAELIEKALKKATGNRSIIKESNIPLGMQPAVLAFFRNEHITKKNVAQRKIITIDNLYLRNDCKLMMKFQLKYFP